MSRFATIALFALLSLWGCNNTTADSASEDLVIEDPAEIGILEAAFREQAKNDLQGHTDTLLIEEEALVTELWQFSDTFELLEQWGLSHAIRLRQPGNTSSFHSYLQTVKKVDNRTREYVPFARIGLGEELDYYTHAYSAIEQNMANVLIQASSIAAQAGDKEKAADFLAAAKFHADSESVPESAPALAEAFAGSLPEDITERRIQRKNEITKTLPAKASKALLQKSEKYVSPDPAIQKSLEDKNVSADPNLIPFLRAYLAQFHSGRLDRLKPFFPEEWWPEEKLVALGEKWKGWSYEEMGDLITVKDLGDNLYELSIPAMLMKSEDGGLREIPVSFMVEKEESGRYKVISLLGAEQLRLSKMVFVDELEAKMQKFLYEQTLQRQRERLNGNGGQ